MVDAGAARIPTWKAGPINTAGRVTLTKTTLSAFPFVQINSVIPIKVSNSQIHKSAAGFMAGATCSTDPRWRQHDPWQGGLDYGAKAMDEAVKTDVCFVSIKNPSIINWYS